MLYEYSCESCGRKFDHEHGMAVHKNTWKCECGEMADQVITGGIAVRGDLDDWSQMNGGRGMYNPQLQCHVKSKQDAIDKGKARGWAKV